MSSLKNLVILVVGDLNADAVVPCWTASNVENWLRLRGIKQVFKTSKSVTHVVCSRAAYADNVPEVQFVKSIKGWNKETKKGVPRLVTYDWLEDTLNDNKPIKHFWAYDPGKPRDIQAILAGRRKSPKKLRAPKAFRVGAEEASEDGGDPQEIVHGDGAKDKTSESVGEHKKPTTAGQAAVRNLDTDKEDKPAQAQKQTEEVTSPEEEVVPRADDRPWEVRVQARVFCDKDGFPYHVELTREKDDKRWVLDVLESTSAPAPAPKAYRFRALLFGARGNVVLTDLRDPGPTLPAALACFARCFRARTGYAWDERLLRARRAEQPLWRYRAPAAGRPTGSVPPKYTPGHPDCVGDLGPIATGCGPARDVTARRERRSPSVAPQRRPETDKNAHGKVLTQKRGQAQKKRKAGDATDSDRQVKVRKSVLPA